MTRPRMNEVEGRALVAALRSGEYLQGEGSLCLVDEDGTKRFCCLGVGTALAVKAGICEWVDGSLVDGGNRMGVRESNEDDGEYVELDSLPTSVAAWLGMGDNYEGHLPDSVENKTGMWFDSLISLNDEGHFTFPEIADIIEEQFLGGPA